MRYAVISDVHANLQAFRAVLTDISAQKIDCVLCLGDVVGYGPQPAEVLSLLHTHVAQTLMGNHDAVLTGRLNADDFDEGARRMLDWTKARLNKAALDVLAAFPYSFAGDGFACSHGDFIDPAQFNYIQNEAEAAKNFSARGEPLLFVGHTHLPAAFVLRPDGTCSRTPPDSVAIEPGCRYLINPGSVGMPRGSDFRASYCIYDDMRRTVTFCRVVYDVQAFRQEVKSVVKNSAQVTYLLNLLDSHALPILQKRVDFSAAPTTATRRTVPAQSGLPTQGTAAGAPRAAPNRAPAKAAPAPVKQRRTKLIVTVSAVAAALIVIGLLLNHSIQGARKEQAARLARLQVADELQESMAVPEVPEGTYAAVISLLGERGVVLNNVKAGQGAVREEQGQRVVEAPASSRAWREVQVSFTPSKDGFVTVSLGGKENEKRAHRWTLYDDMTVSGAEFFNGDFETRVGWLFGSASDRATLVRNPGVARSGRGCLRAGAYAMASQDIRVTANRSVTVACWFKADPDDPGR